MGGLPTIFTHVIISLSHNNSLKGTVSRIVGVLSISKIINNRYNAFKKLSTVFFKM